MLAHRIKAYVKPDQPLILPLPNGLRDEGHRAISGALYCRHPRHAASIRQRNAAEVNRPIDEKRASWS